MIHFDSETLKIEMTTNFTIKFEFTKGPTILDVRVVMLMNALTPYHNDVAP